MLHGNFLQFTWNLSPVHIIMMHGITWKMMESGNKICLATGPSVHTVHILICISRDTHETACS
jgi:hypothetical protein